MATYNLFNALAFNHTVESYYYTEIIDVAITMFAVISFALIVGYIVSLYLIIFKGKEKLQKIICCICLIVQFIMVSALMLIINMGYTYKLSEAHVLAKHPNFDVSYTYLSFDFFPIPVVVSIILGLIGIGVGIKVWSEYLQKKKRIT